MKCTFNKFSLIWQEAITGIEHILPATWFASDHGAKHGKHVSPPPQENQKIVFNHTRLSLEARGIVLREGGWKRVVVWQRAVIGTCLLPHPRHRNALSSRH